MGLEIKGKTQSLQWLSDLMAFFQTETIKIPVKYRARVLEVKKLLREDTSGMVNTMLDFAVDAALVDYNIETDNDNLTDILNDWLFTINAELRGKLPTGIEALAKEYFRERWKGSSHLLLRTFWEKNSDGLILPTTLYFVDGEDIKVKINDKDSAVRLGEERYYLRISDDATKDVRLPSGEDEYIFVQRPFESWGTYEPVPYIIRKGLFRNLKFLQLLSEKGEFIVGRALEYLLVLKKGSERMAIEGRPEMTYDENDLKILSEDLKNLIMRKKSEAGAPIYTTNFDTELEHFIPEYQKAINDVIYGPVEKRILAGLGLVNIVEGVGATRRESIMNPKPFIGQINQGIKDFTWLLNDIVHVIIEKNQKKHPKWMNSKIDINHSAVRDFMTDKFQALLRSMYDRGVLSKRTFVELIGQTDYDIEVLRRKEEKTKGEEDTMYPPVIQNIEGAMEPPSTTTTNEKKVNDKTPEEEVPEDKKGPESRDYNQSSLEEGDYEEAPYKTNKDLPPAVKNLPSGAKKIWRITFNSVYKSTGDEDKARMAAWRNVKLKYKKEGDKWVRKTKGEMEESMEELDVDTLVKLRELEILGKKNKLLDKLIGEDTEDENSD